MTVRTVSAVLVTQTSGGVMVPRLLLSFLCFLVLGAVLSVVGATVGGGFGLLFWWAYGAGAPAFAVLWTAIGVVIGWTVATVLALPLSIFVGAGITHVVWELSGRKWKAFAPPIPYRALPAAPFDDLEEDHSPAE